MFSNWLTSTTAAVVASSNASSPDVILEIGPMPIARQFIAHSAILIAHSGYLRSILRPDERISECPIYVPNITAEHFAPLLTYMYTGFLDLNIENIFGVLLATHVLHMPRALEICRNFLSRLQSDGYSNGNFFDKMPLQSHSMSFGDTFKVVRPIASKATNNGFAFIAPPISKPISYSHDTPFKCINLTVTNSSDNQNENLSETDVQANRENTEEDRKSNSPAASTSQIVDVDRITPEKDDEKITTMIATKPTKFRKTSQCRSKSSQSPKLIETSTSQEKLETKNDAEGERFVVDIASCDGPVRFQRVLNEAYNRFNLKNTCETSTSEQSSHIERNRIHMTNAFHMQMARNIAERQAINLDAGDSENSVEIIVHDRDDKNSKKLKVNPNCMDGSNASTKQDDVFSCVYCKHTFKSQYCYQKHAKRHINPLSIDGAIDSDRDDKSENSSTTAIANTAITSSSTQSSHSTYVKREVRPLDMNVQYYPCKTCGSKFPSYYFVHKHRKLCHANEEN